MVTYDVKKTNLVLQQSKLLTKNDFDGVVRKFIEIETNIVENCPLNALSDERFKFRGITNEWNRFSPEFRFNIKIEEPLLSLGIDEQCAKIGDYFYHFVMSEEKQKSLRKKIPIIRNNGIQTASDGVYTWFIFTDKRGERQFVAKKVLTIQEISTKHTNILSDILEELETIHYAGEFIKNGDVIEINFLSGTYMAPSFENLSANDIIEIKNEAVKFLNQKYKRTLVFKEQNPVETMITSTNIMYTRENMKLLLDNGAIIKRFDTKSFCRKYNNIDRDRIQLENTHAINIRLWGTIGGAKPVLKYPPPIDNYVDVTFENLDVIAFPR